MLKAIFLKDVEDTRSDLIPQVENCPKFMQAIIIVSLPTKSCLTTKAR